MFDNNTDDSNNACCCDFEASYNKRDLILYALSLGFGSSCSSTTTNTNNKNNNDDYDKNDYYDHELRSYLYEKNPNLTAVPTFCVALLFWATKKRSDNSRRDTTTLSGCGGDSYNIPSFPPLIFREIIYKSSELNQLLQQQQPSTKEGGNDWLSGYTILHLQQSIRWHCEERFPVPSEEHGVVRTRLNGKITKINPKPPTGTLITYELYIYQIIGTNNNNKQQRLLCTLTSTILIVSLILPDVTPAASITTSKNHKNDDSARTIPNENQKSDHNKDCVEKNLQPSIARTKVAKTRTLMSGHKSSRVISTHIDQQRDLLDDDDDIYEWTFQTSINQALFYRLASGDSNRIHVFNDDNGGKNKDKAMLHGLCTMGIAVRAILHYSRSSSFCNEEEKNRLCCFLRSIHGRFTKPVFVGDSVSVRIWKKKTTKKHSHQNNNNQIHHNLFFVVTNNTTRETVIDRGNAELIEKRIVLKTKQEQQQQQQRIRTIKSKL